MVRKHLSALLLVPLLAFAQAEPAEAVLIDFEGQANATNVNVTNPFPEASFSAETNRLAYFSPSVSVSLRWLV